MRALLRFAHAIDNFTEKLGGIATFLVLLVVVVGFYNVAARYLGRFVGRQLSSNALIEIQWYIYSLIFFLGFAYVLKHDVNVRVDFLYAKWSPRTKAWVDLIGSILFLVVFCVMGIYVTITPVLFSWGRLPNGGWGTWELSPDPNGLPRAPIKTMIIVAFVTLLLQTFAQIIKYIAILAGHQEVAQEIAEDAQAEGPVG
jgi:TRAP-type mannitol/chloroaromatic compound transport system permease small subunit